jgi:hypothetical protein
MGEDAKVSRAQQKAVNAFINRAVDGQMERDNQ